MSRPAPITTTLARLLLAWLLPVAGLALAPSARAASAPPDTPTAAAARFDFNTALFLLRNAGAHLPAAAPADRLLYAGALLNAQPRSDARIAEALAIARSVDAPEARFLEARILHEHTEPRQPQAAAALYEQLTVLPGFADNPLVRRALVPLALIRLYETPGLSRDERLASAETLLPLATHPPVARDLRYLIGRTLLEWRLDLPRAREHLRAARQIGFSQQPRQISLLVTLGQLAEETGDTALAIDCYRDFLRLTARDSRADTIRQRLAALERPENLKAEKNRMHHREGERAQRSEL
ncbi:hypothetical protein OpiT1DRAFT_04331 [Opitutaceae bacterium TAV1]|nr:hypothetical protein OpiT1DRAFT_04331 [Opitutaceae bacterium TAV1]